MSLWSAFWNDERGYILSAEAVLLGTVGVVGATAGLNYAADSVNEEMKDFSYAFRHLDQSYAISGQRGCGAWTAGSCFVQQPVEVSIREMEERVAAQQERDEAVRRESIERRQELIERKKELRDDSGDKEMNKKKLKKKKQELKKKRRKKRKDQSAEVEPTPSVAT